MPDIALYLQRVSFMLRQGMPANDVAIYLPTDDASLPGFRHLRRITRAGWAADHYELT